MNDYYDVRLKEARLEDKLDSLCEIFQVNLGYLLGTSDDPTPPGAPSNEDISRWSEEDEVESLEHIFRIMTRLNQTSKRIISAANFKPIRKIREMEP